MRHEKHANRSAAWQALGTAAWLAIAGPVALAAGAAPAPAIEQLEELDEVLVHGTNLQDRIVKAEDKFFKLYNELNKDDDYDVNCAYIPLDTDTRIEDRLCMPGFFANAIAEQMIWVERCRGSLDEEGNFVPPPPCYTPPPPDLVLMDRSDDYYTNIMRTIRSDARLGNMAGELDQLHMERVRVQRRYLQLKERQSEERERARDVRYQPRAR